MPSLFRLLNRRSRKWSHVVTDDDIYYCYRLFLRRPPDPDGLAHHRREMARGISLDELVNQFITSDEARGPARWGPTTVEMGGYRVCINEELETEPFLRRIVNTREYEPHVRQAIRDCVQEGDVVVDVGANVGCIALLAAALVGARGLVAAVEPVPENVQLLYAGMEVNEAHNVRVLPYAASDRAGVVSIAGGSNAHLVAAQPPGPAAVYAQAVRLDDALSWLSRLDLVKIDVEGHEVLAFDGFRNLIERHRPALVIEFNPTCMINHEHGDPAALLDRILSLYPRVRVTSQLGDDVSFERATDLLGYWERRNAELTAARRIPDDSLHFDLIAERGRPRPAA